MTHNSQTNVLTTWRTERWPSWPVRARVTPPALNVGSMPGSHQGLCALSGFSRLPGGLRAMFIQRLSLVHVVRSSLRAVVVCGVCRVCDVYSA
jgi:hypothetical protein